MNTESYRPTERFSAKARRYDFRPDYPAEIIGILQDAIGLTPEAAVADIGAGTGKLTRLFLDNGNRVFAVEPNPGMLGRLTENLAGRENLTAVRKPAEDTGLPAESVDLIAVGQAFHWFDAEKVRIEFARVLKTPGFLLLASHRPQFADGRLKLRMLMLIEKYYYKNERRMDYRAVKHRALFTAYPSVDLILVRTIFQDPAAVLEGVLSNSFCPDEDDPQFEAMRRELHSALAESAVRGRIENIIETRLAFGRIR